MKNLIKIKRDKNNYPIVRFSLFNKKDINKIFNYMQHDKKISGQKINLILLSKIGKAKIFPSDLNKNIKPILAQQFN